MKKNKEAGRNEMGRELSTTPSTRKISVSIVKNKRGQA